jgi:putative ABC transport system substrate-binding protein
MMNRRVFAFCVGALVAAPLAALAQRPDRIRRIGVLVGLAATDPVIQPEIAAFQQGLTNLGWRNGANINIEYRWGPSDASRTREHIQELVELQSEVIVSRATSMTAALARAVKTIPIVFVQVSDPVGDSLVASMARPGGNVTGFTNVESSMSGKWLELLKEMSPGIAHVTMLYGPKTSPGGGAYFLGPFEASASYFKVRAIAAAVESDAEIEKAIGAVARVPGGALIVMPGVFVLSRRELIVGLVTRYRIPAVYPFTFWANLGGLMSYGTDSPDLFRRAASYVDRILKGAKPADLPVQAPVKFELVINRNAAKAIGLSIPRSLLLRADRVIE